MLAIVAIERGDHESAARIADEIEESQRFTGQPAASSLGLMRGELALSAGKLEEGRELFRRAVEDVRTSSRSARPGEQLIPWVLATEATALTVEARYGRRDDGLELFTAVLHKLAALIDSGQPFIDFPLTGLMFFAAGSWALHREAVPAPEAVRMLLIAKGFTYPQLSPVLRWEHAAERTEQLAPDLLDRIEAEFGEGRGADLLPQARAALVSFTAPGGSPVA